MAKLLKIMAIVSGAMVAVGIIMVTIAVGMGVRNISSNIDFNFTGYENYFSNEDLDRVVISDELSSADIRIGAGTVIISAGDCFSVEGDNINSTLLKYSSDGENGEIRYETDTTGSSNLGIDKFFSWTCSAEDDFLPELRITVPRDRLDSFRLDFGAGELKLAGVNAGEMKIKVGAGSSKISDITADSLDIEAGFGEVDCENVTAGSSDIKCGMGEMDFENSHLANARFESGVGTVSYEGTLYGNSTLNIGLGDVYFEIDGRPEEYSVDVTPGVGSCYVEGGGQNSSADNKIKINGGAGSLTLDFED